MIIPRAIATALAKYRHAPPSPWSHATRDFAAAHDVLLFVVDMGGIAGMRADGELVEVAWDDQAAKPITSPRWHDLVLLAGAKHYVELEPLLPKRTPQDRDCSSCGGTGTALLDARPLDNVVCSCGGLGFIPSYWTSNG